MAEVVYHLVPTSNHNRWANYILRPMLFIILFLHQTTTTSERRNVWQKLFIILFLHQTTTAGRTTYSAPCCLSSCSYIKPQQGRRNVWQRNVVYHLVPTSNHNKSTASPQQAHVVYHLVPTSNHNVLTSNNLSFVLFIILFLHQTTTVRISFKEKTALFIILFLHQTTTLFQLCARVRVLFIILFLHQTTTFLMSQTKSHCCLSSCSYIKPQPSCRQLG